MARGASEEEIERLLSDFVDERAAKARAHGPLAVEAAVVKTTAAMASVDIGVTGADLRSLEDRLQAQLAALSASQAPGSSGVLARMPVRPTRSVLPLAADEDGFAVTDGAHAESLRASGH